MRDLISRQTAIDAILHNQEVYSNNFGNDPIDKYTIAIIDNDAQTIAQLPSAQPEQRWIPVSDRLPERGVSVLISHVGYVFEDYLDVDDGALFFWNTGFDLDEERQNIAWMPLPEPWKGEANE